MEKASPKGLLKQNPKQPVEDFAGDEASPQPEKGDDDLSSRSKLVEHTRIEKQVKHKFRKHKFEQPEKRVCKATR